MAALTVEQILSAKSCEEIFVNDKSKSKELYRELARKFHPDVYKGPSSSEVFTKINELYGEATSKLEKGIWNEKDVLLIEDLKGKKRKLKYLRAYDFELGKFYIARSHIIYILKSSAKKYLDNAVKVLGNLTYADSQMEKEFKRYFPEIVENFEMKTGEFCLVLKKDKDVFLLEDLDTFYKKQGKKIDPKHLAWIVSRLMNLACFLKFNNLVHNGISMNNCFVSPSQHTIMLYGGWWYCVPVGEKMIGTQKQIFDLMPVKEKAEKVASYKTDLESVRHIGRTMNQVDVPKPFYEWLSKASGTNAMKEFDSWNKALLDSFGKRAFVELDVTEKNIYEE